MLLAPAAKPLANHWRRFISSSVPYIVKGAVAFVSHAPAQTMRRGVARGSAGIASAASHNEDPAFYRQPADLSRHGVRHAEVESGVLPSCYLEPME